VPKGSPKTPLRNPSLLTPKSLRRILQITDGITANNRQSRTDARNMRSIYSFPGMAEQRYEIKQQADGKWAVYDVSTGLPTTVHGFFTIDLSREQADYLMDLLKPPRCKAKRRDWTLTEALGRRPSYSDNLAIVKLEDATLPALSIEIFFQLGPSAKQRAARAAMNKAIVR
jgi:hypothetical protein